MWEHITPVTALAALVLNIITIGIAILLRYQFAEIKLSITEAITKARQEIDERTNRHSAEFAERLDRQGREYGELGTALRAHIQQVETTTTQKIQEVELYLRDEYVRKETFGQVMMRIEDNLKGSITRIETKIDRMEAKIDKRG